MSEPTKEAIEEAAVFAETFQITHRNWEAIDDKRLAKIIAIIRTQAINDTHEVNAVTCCETAEFFGSQTERGRTLIAMAKAIRAMKVPT